LALSGKLIHVLFHVIARSDSVKATGIIWREPGAGT
jgi:hypothetical protein